ncbi:MAG: RagB/SusD family nutrient uptake outer membrane protein [Bacteroidales bacterium]
MKKILIYILSTLMFTSCQLTDVINQNPPNHLVPENVLQNEGDAAALLNGVYSTIISYSSAHYYMYSELIPSGMSGSMSSIGSGSANTQFTTNTLLFDNSNVNSFWIILYQVVNGANNVIELVGEMEEDQFEFLEKSELIGEAHFLRAMATFDALRYFGEFYDLDSRYGIILRDKPVNFITRDKARSTVQESYDKILSDLDFAISNAPDFSVSFKGSKLSAKALKARVLLFMGRYTEAAAMAQEVISFTGRSLESTFAGVFDKGMNSTEMIFLTHRHENSDTEDNNRKRFYGGRTGTTWLPGYMNGDPRQAVSYSGTTIKKTNHAATFRPTYFIRLAEMYLILAEALAFSGATLDDIMVPLNTIRLRAGIGESQAATLDAVKEDIFAEYVRELVFENGSEWFAAIRFDKIMQLNSTIKSVHQFILPIPKNEIAGNGALDNADQNQGYI